MIFLKCLAHQIKHSHISNGSLNESLQLATEDSTDEWSKNKTRALLQKEKVAANFPECNITPHFNLQCLPCPTILCNWTN